MAPNEDIGLDILESWLFYTDLVWSRDKSSKLKTTSSIRMGAIDLAAVRTIQCDIGTGNRGAAGILNAAGYRLSARRDLRPQDDRDEQGQQQHRCSLSHKTESILRDFVP